MPQSVDWMRRLKIRHLEVFVTLVQTANQSEAARLLNITQPALSKWLRELEQDAGGALFLRERGMVLTPLGTAFLKYADRILGESEALTDEMEALRLGKAGRVRVGVLHAVVSELLPNAILRFRLQAPRVRIHLEEDTLEPLLDQLQRRELDLVIGRLQGMTPDCMIAETLYDETVTAVVRAGHPLIARASAPSWQEAANYPWIVPPAGVPMRLRLEAEFAAAGVPFPEELIVSRLALVNEQLLRQTDMICLFSRNVARYYTKTGDLTALPLPMHGMLGPVGLFRNQAPLSPAVEDFAAAIRAVLVGAE